MHGHQCDSGQHDDAAMGLAVALTAAKEGATVLNHAGVSAVQR